MNIEQLENKKILILGFGKEGKDTLAFLRARFPEKKIGIADKREIKVKNSLNLNLHLGKDYFEAVRNYHIIFATAGLARENIQFLKENLRKDQELTSQTKFFLNSCPGLIIGVTGTKGKGTTASLIHNILQKDGQSSYLVGNIGRPPLGLLDQARKRDVFVFELSARQLQLAESSPHIAVLLNFYRSHLDYYQNLEQYYQAKRKITAFQKKNDYLVFNQDQERIRKIARQSKARKISFSLKPKADCYLEQNSLFWKEKPILNTKKVPLLGRFNLYNVMAAISVAQILKISKKSIIKGIEKFKPLPYRLEKVGEFKEITFYNDSLATVPQATIKALKTLGSKVQTIILGGYEAGQNFTLLAKRIVSSNLENIILFPPTGERIRREILRVGERNPHFRKRDVSFLSTKDIKKAVQWAFQNTDSGKIVLLSPAAPSFGVFENYKQRGDLFSKWVKQLGER